MGLSVSDKLAFIREYKKQGGKGNYLSAIKQYADGGEVTQSIPYQALTNQQVWQSTTPKQPIVQSKPLNFNYQPNTQKDNIPQKPLVYDTNPKNKESNQTQLDKYGITQDQEQSSNIISNIVRDRLSSNLKPVGYQNMPQRVIDAVVLNNKSRPREIMEKKASNPGEEYDEYRRRLDAFALYTGKPQKYNTFKISNYKPSKSTDFNPIYYSITDDVLANQILQADLTKGKLQSADESNVMGKFTITEGEDEKGKYRSYYDKWDIAPLDFGNPMEIYDRIYYNAINPTKNSSYKNTDKRRIISYN